jgi:hypothetical protein
MPRSAIVWLIAVLAAATILAPLTESMWCFVLAIPTAVVGAAWLTLRQDR